MMETTPPVTEQETLPPPDPQLNGNLAACREEDKPQNENIPINAYPVLMGAYTALFATLLIAAQKDGRGLPERFSLGDIALLGVATHKGSRLLTKELVTSPLRARFCEHTELTGLGEVHARPIGEGLQRAIGELLTCPGCMGHWVATAFTFGLVLSPRATRLVGSIFAAITISDFLHMAYVAGKEKTT